MAGFPESPKRWAAGIFLGIALLMVILGMTVLESRLKGVSFMIYWLVCVVFTLSAATVALMDASAIRREAVREHRKLIESTLAEVEEEQQRNGDSQSSEQKP